MKRNLNNIAASNLFQNSIVKSFATKTTIPTPKGVAPAAKSNSKNMSTQVKADKEKTKMEKEDKPVKTPKVKSNNKEVVKKMTKVAPEKKATAKSSTPRVSKYPFGLKALDQKLLGKKIDPNEIISLDKYKLDITKKNPFDTYIDSSIILFSKIYRLDVSKN